jgi:hypothetical protein
MMKVAELPVFRDSGQFQKKRQKAPGFEALA